MALLLFCFFLEWEDRIVTSTDLIGELSKIELDSNYRELDVGIPDSNTKEMKEVAISVVNNQVIIYPKDENKK